MVTADPKQREAWWLRNDCAEALVVGWPRLRLLSFRFRGGRSPLRECPEGVAEGVRTWFMEPGQIPGSRGPGEQPAIVRPVNAWTVAADAERDPDTGLQLSWVVRLAEDAPRLEIRHHLVNHHPARRIAAWVIAAVKAEGAGFATMLTPSGRVLWPEVARSDPALWVRDGVAGLRLEAGGPPGKIGVCTRAGQVWYDGGDVAFESSVVRIDDASYPEGGGDVTLYRHGGAGQSSFGEIEHVGPLTAMGAGGRIELLQQLSLLSPEAARRAAGLRDGAMKSQGHD